MMSGPSGEACANDGRAFLGQDRCRICKPLQCLKIVLWKGEAGPGEPLFMLGA